MIPGIQLEEVWKAIANAFDLDELDMMLRFRLNIKRQNIVGNGPLDDVVFKILNRAEAQGWDVDLIQAAYRQNPRNKNLAIVYQKYGLGVQTSLQKEGLVSSPSLAATDAGLESIVTSIQMVDMDVWREKLTRIESRVCRVELNGNPAGTGFLVGSDAILTNYHVLESVLKGAIPPTAVACRFDYKVLSDGSREEGKCYSLHPTQWRLDESPYSAAEKAGTPEEPVPTPDELDYALVRLQTPAGLEPVDAKAVAGAAKRGWVRVPQENAAFPVGMPLLIAQHPDGAPLKLALDTRAVLGENSNHTRVRYSTNTEPGASGSPCFNLQWDLVALHHYGDPAYNQPKFNQGVPISIIRDRLTKNLTKNNLQAAVGGDPP
jgi:hypothetical protein